MRTTSPFRGTLLLLLAVGGAAQGQTTPSERYFELERLRLNPGQGSLVMGDGTTLAGGEYRLATAFHYESSPLRLVGHDGEPNTTLVGSRMTLHLGGAVGLTSFLDVGAQVPVIALQSGTGFTPSHVPASQRVEAPAAAGLGTPYVTARLNALRQANGAPIDLGLEASTGLPVGSPTALGREETFTFLSRLVAGRDFGAFAGALETGAMLRPYTHRYFVATGTNANDTRSEVQLGALLRSHGEGLRGELSVLAAAQFHRLGSPSVEALAGARYPIAPGLELFSLLGGGVGGVMGTPAFRVLIGAAYGGGKAPPKLDPCAPGQAHEPAQCPELDDDSDGLKNAIDRCALEPEDMDGFMDGDGCVDVDDDVDGVPDTGDKCPREPGEARYGGCPPPDADRDGVLDPEDRCPKEAGPADRQGCPIKDGDGDGLIDENDACPTEAGIPETRGCPPKDADGDEIADHLDNCPKEKGPASNQGCPPSEKQLVVITKEKLVIKDKIYFATNKAIIQRKSFKLMDQIASVLREHPELEKIVIEGHTDDRGKAEANRRLSQARANAVRDYLVQKGVSASRLEAKGYGPDRPAASNRTAAGREQNRRVEFIIVHGDAPPSSP